MLDQPFKRSEYPEFLLISEDALASFEDMVSPPSNNLAISADT
jgi:hypothetical protein